MSFLLTGALLFVVGKIIHSEVVSQIGLALIIIDLILMVLGFIGISIALPFAF